MAGLDFGRITPAREAILKAENEKRAAEFSARAARQRAEALALAEKKRINDAAIAANRKRKADAEAKAIREETTKLDKFAGITPTVKQIASEPGPDRARAQAFLVKARARVSAARAFLSRNPTTITSGRGAVRITRTVPDAGKIRATANVIAAGESVAAFNRLFQQQTRALGRAKGAAKGASIKAGTTSEQIASRAGIGGNVSSPVNIFRPSSFAGQSVSLTVGNQTVFGTRQTPGGPITQSIPKNIVPFEFAISPPKNLIGPTQFHLSLSEQLGIISSIGATTATTSRSPIKSGTDFSFAKVKEGLIDRGALPFGQFAASAGQTVKDIHGFIDPENKLGVFFNPAIEKRTASVKSLFKSLGTKETKASSSISEIISGSRFIKTSQGPLFIPGIPKTTEFGLTSDVSSLAFDLGLGLLPTRKVPLPIKAPALNLVTDSGQVKTIIRELSLGFGPLQKPVLTKTQGGFTRGGVFKPGVLEKSALKEITATGESLEFSSGGKFSTKILTSPQAQDILRSAGKALPRDKEIVALKTELAGLIQFSAKKVPDEIRLKVKALPDTPLSTVAAGAESKALRTQVLPIAPKTKGSFAETIQLESKFLARQAKDPLASLKTLRESTTKDLDIDFGDKIFGTFRAKRFQSKGIGFLDAITKGKFVKAGTNVKLKKDGETVLNILTKRDAKTGGSLGGTSKFPFGIKIDRSVNVPVELGSRKTAEFVTIEENALNRLRAGLGLFGPKSTKAKQESQRLRFLKPGFDERLKTPSGFGIGPAEFGLKHDAKLIGQDAPQIAENLIAAGFLKEGKRVKAIGLRLEGLLEEIDFGVLPVEKIVSKSSSSPLSKSIGKIIDEAPDIVTGVTPGVSSLTAQQIKDRTVFHGTTREQADKFIKQGPDFFKDKDIGFSRKGSPVLFVGSKSIAQQFEKGAVVKILTTKKLSGTPSVEQIITSKSIIQEVKPIGQAFESITKVKPISKPLQSKSISTPLQKKSISSGVSSSLGLQRVSSSLGKLRVAKPNTGSIGKVSFGKLTASPGSLGSVGELTGKPGKGPSPGSPGSIGEITGKPGPGSPGGGGSLGSLGDKGPGILRTETIGPRIPFVNIGAIVRPTKPSPRKRRVDFLGSTFSAGVVGFRTKKDFDFGREKVQRIVSKELRGKKRTLLKL